MANLKLAWAPDLPGETSLEATPLEVDGVLYFTGRDSAVYAVNAATETLIWKYDPKYGMSIPHAYGLCLELIAASLTGKAEPLLGRLMAD